MKLPDRIINANLILTENTMSLWVLFAELMFKPKKKECVPIKTTLILKMDNGN